MLVLKMLRRKGEYTLCNRLVVHSLVMVTDLLCVNNFITFWLLKQAVASCEQESPLRPYEDASAPQQESAHENQHEVEVEREYASRITSVVTHKYEARITRQEERKYEDRITPRVMHQCEERIAAEDLTPVTAEEDDLPSWAEEYRVVWSDLTVDDRVLGSGNFGEVRSGAVRKDGEMIRCAVKMLKGKFAFVLG